MVVKTRERLIEVARQLFAHKGIENTTMSDIANASEKGRRTIYTYFKNKRDIYNAVVEKESEHMVERLRSITEAPLPPLEKLMKFVDKRLDIMEETVGHKPDDAPVLRSFFSREVRRIERIRSLAMEKELHMLRDIFREGLRSGDFDPAVCHSAFTAMLIMFQGLEIACVRNNFGQLELKPEEVRQHLKAFILAGIRSRKAGDADPDTLKAK